MKVHGTDFLGPPCCLTFHRKTDFIRATYFSDTCYRPKSQDPTLYGASVAQSSEVCSATMFILLMIGN